MKDKAMSGHKHHWKPVIHTDSCCSFSWRYGCTRCGSTLSTLDERDPTADPWAMVWMEDPCPRCEALIAGAPTRHAIKITRKDGTVEREEEHETPQGEFSRNAEEESDD